MKRLIAALLGSAGLATMMILSVAGVASADATHACNNSGHGYCIGVPGNLGQGHQVYLVSGTGRTMEFHFDGNNYCTPDHSVCGPEGTLVFTGGSNDCVVAPSSTNVYDGPCSGVTGDLWMENGPTNGKTHWVNRYLTNLAGNGPLDLTSDNVLNDELTVDMSGCSSNCYQAWNGPAQA